MGQTNKKDIDALTAKHNRKSTVAASKFKNKSDEICKTEPKDNNTKELKSYKRKRNNDDDNPHSEDASGAKNIIVNKKIKAPTLEEINELKETRNLFHSNLFRLQIKEMLTELKVKDKYKTFIKSWLEIFSSFINSLDSDDTKKNSVHVPLALHYLKIKTQNNVNFEFIKPNVPPLLIGAAATNTLIGSKLVVDVAVIMPKEYFQKENYLNLAYDQKRAMYMQFIASKMIECKFFGDLTTDHMKFNYFGNNPLKPVLEITLPPSTGKISNKLSIRIFIGADQESFKLSRFVPWNNNVRPSMFGENEENTVLLATPNYNASVLFDLTMKSNQELLDEVFNGRNNLEEGLILLKVWLQQRQLNVGFTGFNNHILAMFIAYLYKKRKLHNNMSSYQVARNVWNSLAYSKWDENLYGITLCASSETSNKPTMEQFHANYDVVFVDQTGFYNICSNLSVEIYRRVRTESKITIDLLNDMHLNSFQIIFMTKFRVCTQFDHILKINKTSITEKILEKHGEPKERYRYAGNAYPQLVKIVTNLLRKGLNQRIFTIMPIERQSEAWCVSEKPKGINNQIHLGIILNKENALEVLDKGPKSIDEGAEEFRRFWGSQAQLRRFQDGSITESVVWAQYSDTLVKKRLIVRTIVKYLLQYHLQLGDNDIEYFAGEFDVAFKLNPLFKTEKMLDKNRVDQDTDAEALSINVIRSFDDLSRKLYNLSELPLEIASISGISPVFRYCDPTPIVPQARCIQEQLYSSRIQWGVIQLGLSGKWPDELEALRALKIAFYIQIAKLLREKHKLRTKVTLDGVLVLKNGYVFGFEIAHQKEVSLLKKEKTENGITKYIDNNVSIAMEKKLYILPKLTGALHGLYQMHPSFGATVMIAKRWLYSQLIDDGIWPDECTELLIASQFLKTHSDCIPCQPQVGFFRFLQLLANTDWKTEMVLINFNNELDEKTISDLENRFTMEREYFPPLCIVTAYDLSHSGLVWTSHLKPNLNILTRVTILAREALSIIDNATASIDRRIQVTKLFSACNQGYDLVIQLKPDLITNSLSVEFGSPFAPFTRPNFRMPLAGMDYLKNSVELLREAYSEYAAFFYNPCGGKEIGIIWKPNVFDEKEFKVNEVNGCSVIPKASKIQCKKDVLIEDFKVVLKDLYLRIGPADSLLKETKHSNIV